MEKKKEKQGKTNFFTTYIDKAKALCEFSTYYFVLKVLSKAFGVLKLQKALAAVNRKKDRWILDFLYGELESVLTKYEKCSEKGTYNQAAPIWLCWWGGEKDVPVLVERCIESIREHSGDHPVYMITEENYSEYLDIPDYILENVNLGKMKLAHLADYIRVKLLAQYGGLWLDATIFCSQPIPAYCFELPVFSCKGPVKTGDYISDYRWTTFCLGGWKGNLLYRYLVDAFEVYWRNNCSAVDYLFFDYIIRVAYECIPYITEQIDRIPDNNIHRDDLQRAMSAATPWTDMKSVFHDDTVFYKLSWKDSFDLSTKEGEMTIYTYLFCRERQKDTD